MGYHDAETIRRAVDLLRADKPADAVLAAGVTPLSSTAEVADWMSRAATHTAAHPFCCRAGAAYCPYAGLALKRARRVIAAAPQNNATASASTRGSASSRSGETKSKRAPAGG